MAKDYKPRTVAKKKNGGGTLLGVFIGLILGLIGGLCLLEIWAISPERLTHGRAITCSGKPSRSSGPRNAENPDDGDLNVVPSPVPRRMFHEYDALIDAGADHFSFCYEFEDPEVFAEICPGKADTLGQEAFFEAMNTMEPPTPCFFISR